MGNGRVGRLSEDAYSAMLHSRATKGQVIHQNSARKLAPGEISVKPGAKSGEKIYRSKLELSWAVRLEVMKRNGEIDGWIYEPFTFRLAEGKRYRADFIAWKNEPVQYEDGPGLSYPIVTCFECKGWHKNYRDSMTHLKWVAQRFPFFQWKKVVRNGKSGFEVYDVVV